MASVPALVNSSLSVGTRALGMTWELARLPGRVLDMVDSGEVMLARADVLLARAEGMVDDIERTVSHTENLVPVLAGLDKLGPDVAELLRVTDDMRRTVLGLPGLGLLRRGRAEVVE